MVGGAAAHPSAFLRTGSRSKTRRATFASSGSSIRGLLSSAPSAAKHSPQSPQRREGCDAAWVAAVAETRLPEGPGAREPRAGACPERGLLSNWQS
jgi:hypothetical protein